MTSPYKVQSPEHALRCGFVWGLAMRNGLDILPELDEDGNYAPSALIDIPDLGHPVTVRIVVDAGDPAEPYRRLAESILTEPNTPPAHRKEPADG